VLSEPAVMLPHPSDRALAEFNFLHRHQSQRQASGTAPTSPGSQKPEITRLMMLKKCSVRGLNQQQNMK